MNLTLPNYPLAAGVIDRTKLNENLNALLQHEITDADISASAAITVTKLAAYYKEVNVTLMYTYDATAWSAQGTTAPLADNLNEVGHIMPLPNDAGDTYTATHCTWFCNGTGTVAGTFDVIYGYYDASSGWNTVGTLFSAVTMTVPATAGEIARGSTTGSNTIDPDGTNSPYLIALRKNGSGTSVLDAAGNNLVVTVRLRRPLTSV